MTRVESENTRLRHYLARAASKDTMLLQIRANAEAFNKGCYCTISNSGMSLFQSDSYAHSATPEYLRSQRPDAKLLIIWDGASYHRSQQIKDYLDSLNAAL